MSYRRSKRPMCLSRHVVPELCRENGSQRYREYDVLTKRRNMRLNFCIDSNMVRKVERTTTERSLPSLNAALVLQHPQQTLEGPALRNIVTTSQYEKWVMCRPTAFIRCGGRFSRPLSGTEPSLSHPFLPFHFVEPSKIPPRMS
jgi:hypothetical protein